jgi:hypothetical protein
VKVSRTLRALAAATAALALAGHAGPPAAADGQGTSPAPAVVPALQQWSGANGSFQLPQDARVVVGDEDAKSLGTSLEAFAEDLRAITGRSLPVIQTDSAVGGDVVIAVDPNVPKPAVKAGDEVYELEIDQTITLRGRTASAVQRGMQTIEQLFSLDDRRVTIPKGSARDWPLADDRGFMLDAGRHYYQPEYIEYVIRSMAWYKLDTLHLHLTEWNAFRLDSPAFPGLAAEDAYTEADIARFEETAARYGVEILPEIDLPAHATAIADWAPDTKWDCSSASNWFERDFTLDITKPATEAVVKSILDEFIPWFDGPRFHVGTDEYPTAQAQAQCPELVDYAARNGYANTADVFVDFIDTMNEMVKAHGKRTVIWNWWNYQQQPTKAPSDDIIVEAWTGDPQPYIDLGYDVISSDSSRFYVTPSAPPGGALLPNSEWINSAFVPADSPAMQGYLISRWSDGAFFEPDNYFEWFAARPQQVLADRAWGGPPSASNFALEEKIDRVGPPPSLIADIPPGSVPLTGEVYASGEPYDHHGLPSNAFDGDPNTFVDLAASSGGYVGLDLGPGDEAAVAGIRVVPRSGTGVRRLLGGRFQGCTDGPDAGCVDLATVDWMPFRDWLDLTTTNANAYRWLRYLSPAGGFTNVAEIQFLTQPKSDVRTVVEVPKSFQALADNRVTVEVRNDGAVAREDVRVDLQVRSGVDYGRVNAVPRSPIPHRLEPGQTHEVQFSVPLDLKATVGEYRIQATTSWQAGENPAMGRERVLAGGAASLGGTVTVDVDPRVPVVDDKGHASLGVTVTNRAAEPVMVTVTPDEPEGLKIMPKIAKVRVAAGVSEPVTFRVTAESPGLSQIPIHTVATHRGSEVELPVTTARVTVPYDELMAAFDQHGMTSDDNVSPDWLGGGVDGDGSSISWNALADAGVVPGGTVSHGGFRFKWPDPDEGEPDHLVAAGQAIRVGSRGSELGLLTTGAYAPVSGTGQVHYTDGTVSAFTIADPDWHQTTPESAVAIAMPYNNYAPVGQVQRNTYVFFHAVPLDPGKIVDVVVLPTSDQGGKYFHRVFAMEVKPANS